MNGTQYLLSAICDLSSHSSQGENDGCGLNQLNIQEIVIGGLSMGGQIVMEFCRLYPERVRGVLLAATFPRAKQKRVSETERKWRIACWVRVWRKTPKKCCLKVGAART